MLETPLQPINGYSSWSFLSREIPACKRLAPTNSSLYPLKTKNLIMNPKLKTKKGATSYFSWDRNWLWPKNNIQVLKLTRFWKDSPTLKNFNSFRGVSARLFWLNHRTSDRTDAGETLNSGARTKGVLEPRLSGLGLRESFCFLGIVSNHEMETCQDTHPKYHELLPSGEQT